MTSLFDSLRARASARPQRILLPEANDPRVISAALQLVEQELAIPVLLEPHAECEEVETFTTVSDQAEWRERALQRMREHHKLSPVEAEQALQNPLQIAAALLAVGYVDAGVAGSIATTSDVLRAGLRAVGVAEGCTTVSSFFLLELLDGRVLSYADCAVVPEPSVEQLAQIAIATAASHAELTGDTPRVAMLSFSSHGSAQHASVTRVVEATNLVRELAPGLLIDGELQFDAAINPNIAARKVPDSALAGDANVFIFPDLNSGNIAYKVTQQLAGVKAIGPLLQGMARPWMDLSRGCSVEDIVETAVIASLMASLMASKNKRGSIR